MLRNMLIEMSIAMLPWVCQTLNW